MISLAFRTIINPTIGVANMLTRRLASKLILFCSEIKATINANVKYVII